MVKGNFSRHFLRVGYHKIVEIPAGAQNISILETLKSRNYLGTHIQAHTQQKYFQDDKHQSEHAMISLQLCWPKAVSLSSTATGWLTGQDSSLLWEHSWHTNDPMKSVLAAEKPSLHLGRWVKTCTFMWDAIRHTAGASVLWLQRTNTVLSHDRYFLYCSFTFPIPDTSSNFSPNSLTADLSAARSPCILWIQCASTKHTHHPWASDTFRDSTAGWVHKIV